MNKTDSSLSRIVLPGYLCELEAVRYIAFRHSTTPEEVLEHFFVQCGIFEVRPECEKCYTLSSNEMNLLYDLGVKPSVIEII